MFLRFRLLLTICLVWLCLGVPTVSLAQMGWRLGQQVEIFRSGKWYPGEIVAVREGKYEIHYPGLDDSRNEWVLSTRIRPRSAAEAADNKAVLGASITTAPVASAATTATPAPTATAAATSPRLGRYNVQTYGGGSGTPVPLGSFELTADGTYRFFDNSGRAVGEGKYTFDTAAGKLQWVSGPFQRTGWGGDWEISPDAVTHTIRLTKTVSGSNSAE